MSDDDLVPFRFEIPSVNIANLTLETVTRLEAFLTGGQEVASWKDYAKDATVVAGKAPQPHVTAVQALAMGHDVDAVLDMLESR